MITVIDAGSVKRAGLWTEVDDVIHFTVTSDGTTGPNWIRWLENNGFLVSDYAKSVLGSPDFKPTTGVNYHMAAIRGKFWKSDGVRLTSNIRQEAASRKWGSPNAETACLSRKLFSDEELEKMGLWRMVVMHEPIRDSAGAPSFLRADRGDYGRWIDTCYASPTDGWSIINGFAFRRLVS